MKIGTTTYANFKAAVDGLVEPPKVVFYWPDTGGHPTYAGGALAIFWSRDYYVFFTSGDYSYSDLISVLLTDFPGAVQAEVSANL